jgi:DNA-binding response OmpR family regulator
MAFNRLSSTDAGATFRRDHLEDEAVRILVVEDDDTIADAVMHGLRRSGHVTERLADGESADATLHHEHFDAIILDLGLPGVDGLTLLRRMRGRGDNTPVLILSARDTLDVRIRGLDDGADDYIYKPFEMAELEARLRAVARRAIARSGGDVAVGPLRLKPGERRFYLDGTPLELSPREYAVLEVLLLRHGQVISKAQIQNRLSDWNEELTEAAIELYVHRIRRKLSGSIATIRTVRGFGYLLQSDDG